LSILKRKKRNIFEVLNNEIIIISVIFIIFVVIGACINKFYPEAQNSIAINVSGANEYYSSDVNLKNILISNLKSDILFLSGIAICTLTIVLLPISIGIFILKGLAIGYTINSVVLALKINSLKIILITLAKSIIILPGILILSIVSLKYITHIVNEIRKNNRSKIAFLCKRYALNSSIIIIITTSSQFIINAISIATLKFLF
jgi:stage II sporulation protein M